MKPVLYLIPAFDKTIGTVIKFTWAGNQPVSNTVIIRDNTTNVVVYEKTIDTMRLEHTIQSNGDFINGKLYNIVLKITDNKGFFSEWSDAQLFYCYSTPSFSINIEQDQIIQAQTYGVNITYSQSEGELLQSYRVQVFNSNNAIVYDSNIRYILDTVMITNLQDNNHYTIIATGETINGMFVSTDVINFSADFIKSETYFMCELQNMYDTGGIYIKSNIVSIEGSSDAEVVYIDNDIADLTNNVVHFNKGFSISEDFSLLVRGYGFEANTNILQLAGNDEVVTVEYKCTPKGVYYFELCAIYKHNKYVITLNNPYHNNEVSLRIRRKNTLFEMEVAT